MKYRMTCAQIQVYIGFLAKITSKYRIFQITPEIQGYIGIYRITGRPADNSLLQYMVSSVSLCVKPYWFITQHCVQYSSVIGSSPNTVSIIPLCQTLLVHHQTLCPVFLCARECRILVPSCSYMEPEMTDQKVSHLGRGTCKLHSLQFITGPRGARTRQVQAYIAILGYVGQ